MTYFLVINCGTSSVKMTLFTSNEEKPRRVLHGHLSNLFSSLPILKIGEKEKILAPLSSYSQAITIILDYFEKQGYDPSSLQAIGHRVVHGGEKYSKSTLITPIVKKALESLSDLAPLHNPPAIEGINCSIRLFPTLPQIAVFDTAFHAQLPPKAAFYPIPWELSQKYGIKRYGFHGIAHAFSWQRYWDTFGKERNHNKVITIHLGSGCSLAAINEGKSVDTTMGFTPLDGVMMASRCGELDPSIVAFLCEKERKSPQDVIDIFNHASGLLGISGKTGDMQDILKESSADPREKLALDMYIYHILKKIGAFIAVLGGVDAIVFSGGVGENSTKIRAALIDALQWYSVIIDPQKNEDCIKLPFGEIKCIHDLSSQVFICVVGNDENLFIAEEMQRSSHF